MKEIRPHPRNAPGDFYVELNCCTLCGVPSGAAPDLFDEDHSHCFVVRQPETPDEWEQMFEAIDLADLDCIRYRGTDPAVIKRMREMSVAYLCDHRPDDAPSRRDE